MENPMDDIPQRRPATQFPALVLIVAGILGAVVMAFHPAAHSLRNRKLVSNV